jgi:transcriptional regulator of acetoin/glycerol metabolism
MSIPLATDPGITHTKAPEAGRSPLVLALVLKVANGSLARTGAGAGFRRSGRPEEEPVRSEAQVREVTGWNVTEAAKVLAISRGQMLRLMEKLGIKRPGK